MPCHKSISLPAALPPTFHPFYLLDCHALSLTKWGAQIFPSWLYPGRWSRLGSCLLKTPGSLLKAPLASQSQGLPAHNPPAQPPCALPHLRKIDKRQRLPWNASALAGSPWEPLRVAAGKERASGAGRQEMVAGAGTTCRMAQPG